MDEFFKELLSTSKTVLLGRTDIAVERLIGQSPLKLLAFEAVIGIITGIHMSIQSASPMKLIGVPLFLISITILWAFLFAIFGEVCRDNMIELYSLFIGSSLFLSPVVIPILGPILVQALFIGWPFVLARFISCRMKKSPGKIFIQLTLPIIIFWGALILIFYVAGKFLFNVFLA
ncbi:TPA: hypothetical protein DEF17_00635 [bacterium]|nr:MAG: hypothetical protein AUJ18_00700 [Candidatus Hydrogenedentes bacterium CG1_02_42_14]PIU46213.1 MAG: hypothetical protein COS94_10990 [Candidatus Hydrogenedentes bacterium CG07_land_8_20_14_0_80_42_17]HBW46423.1 hypothetical protein [bacterium]